jgi:hypothetical protein
MVFLPKFISKVFDEANQGAEEALPSCRMVARLNILARPRTTAWRADRIVTNATTQVDAIMISNNNAGDQIAPAAGGA